MNWPSTNPTPVNIPGALGGTGITVPPQPQRDTITRRLDQMAETLAQCLALSDNLMKAVGCGVEDKDAQATGGPGLSGLTLHVSNQAIVLRNRLESILNALA